MRRKREGRSQILFYNGDVDTVCNHAMNRLFIDNLNLTIQGSELVNKAWYYNGEDPNVGGFQILYSGLGGKRSFSCFLESLLLHVWTSSQCVTVVILCLRTDRGRRCNSSTILSTMSITLRCACQPLRLRVLFSALFISSGVRDPKNPKMSKCASHNFTKCQFIRGSYIPEREHVTGWE